MIKESVKDRSIPPALESPLVKHQYSTSELVWITGLPRQTLINYASRLKDPGIYGENGLVFSQAVTIKIFRLPIVKAVRSLIHDLEESYGQKVYSHSQATLVLGTENIASLVAKGNLNPIERRSRKFYTQEMVDRLKLFQNPNTQSANPDEPQYHKPTEAIHEPILKKISLQDIDAMQDKAKVCARNPNFISSWPRLGQLLGIDARSAQLLIYLGCQLSKQEAVSFNDFQSGESEDIRYFRIPTYLDALRNFLVENNLNLYDLFVKLKPINAQNLKDFEKDSTRNSAFSTSTALSILR